MSRILVFFPYSPIPAWHGAHRRCVEMLVAMRDLGHEVSFATSAHASGEGWKAHPEILRKEGLAAQVFAHRYTPTEEFTWALRQRVSWRLSHMGLLQLDTSSRPRIGPWFRHVIDRVSPDILFMNYSVWDWLVPEAARKRMTTVMETHDLVSVNQKMQAAIQPYLGPKGRPLSLRAADVPDALIREDFFRSREFSPDPEELQAFDRYNHTIAISESEARFITEGCPRTRTHYLPVTQRVSDLTPRYEGPVLFPIGPNLFNVQGYLFFVRRVLPIVRRAIPDFRLRVTGTFAQGMQFDATDGVEFSGFVDDFPSVLASSSFVICPVFGGTGQQVKIVEAMANALPVVAMRAAADRSPLEHGVSGLVADSPEAFAEHVIALWNDRARCRIMGDAGRAFVRDHLSQRDLTAKLSVCLSPVSAAASA